MQEEEKAKNPLSINSSHQFPSPHKYFNGLKIVEFSLANYSVNNSSWQYYS